MSEIILPIYNPPQISKNAHGLVKAQILENGFFNTVSRAQASFGLVDQILSNYIDNLGAGMSHNSPKLPWHKNVLKLGAGLAWHAYRETGYLQSIDEHFEVAEVIANFEGIPDAYLYRLECDQNLISLLDHTVVDGSESILERADVKQVLGIGAGCVRFYLEQAIEIDAA